MIPIVLVGDSIVEGLEIDYEKTFHKLLENQLNEAFDEQFEVINLSAGGYSTAQELLALKRYKEIIQPDIVLLVFFTGNDYGENLRETFAYLDKEGNLKFQESASWLGANYLIFKRWIYENSHLVFFLKNSIESAIRLRVFSDNAKKIDLSNLSVAYVIKLTQLLILEMKNEAKK